MKLLYLRCGGLDINKKEVVVCLRFSAGRKTEQQLSRFPTDTLGLLERFLE